MSQVTLSRNGTSVTFDAVGEGVQPTVVYAASKPEQDITPVSNVDPRVSDQFQSVKQFTVNGYFKDSSAYEDARTLAEELIKPHSNGDDLTLDLSNVSGFSTYTVAPNTSEACTLTYPPGQRNMVEVRLQLTAVDETIAGSASETITPSTTTANNGGDITLTNPANSQAITLSSNLRIERTVGRPNTTVRDSPASVSYIDKVRSASDVWNISGRLTNASARSDGVTLIEDILGTPLGRDALTLDFNNNLFALDSYDVVPEQRGGRVVVSASEKGELSVQGLRLRTVLA